MADIQTASIDDVVQFLRAMDQARRDLGRMNGTEIKTVDSVILSAGRPWKPARRPPGLRKMRDGSCYRNAWALASRAAGLRYVEGYAATPLSPLPVLHGWCVNDDDVVIDPTWKDPANSAYYGVVIPQDVLGAMMYAVRYYGFFGNDFMVGHVVAKLGRLPTADEIRQAADEREERRNASHS